MSCVHEIKLFNHLGNGGSFTLNGSKEVSVSVSYVGWSSGSVTLDDCYPSNASEIASKVKTKVGNYYLWYHYADASGYQSWYVYPKPSSLVWNGTTYTSFSQQSNGSYRWYGPIDTTYGTDIRTEGSVTIK